MIVERGTRGTAQAVPDVSKGSLLMSADRLPAASTCPLGGRVTDSLGRAFTKPPTSICPFRSRRLGTHRLWRLAEVCSPRDGFSRRPLGEDNVPRTGSSARRCRYLLLVSLLWAGVSCGSEARNITCDPEAGRADQGSAHAVAVPEIRAEVVFDAPPASVHRVLTDYDQFARFVPEVAQSRVLRRAGDVRWVYQRLEFPPPVAPREYLLRITDRLHPRPGVYATIAWSATAPAGSSVPDSDAVTPKRFDGHWVLRPARGGRATAATYGVDFDPGGSLPGWLIAAMADRYALSVIEALRRRISLLTCGSECRATPRASVPPATALIGHAELSGGRLSVTPVGGAAARTHAG
jgi:ribosome-associated toxin RatA of RatAB toxin-antitoxin module